MRESLSMDAELSIQTGWRRWLRTEEKSRFPPGRARA